MNIRECTISCERVYRAGIRGFSHDCVCNISCVCAAGAGALALRVSAEQEVKITFTAG